MDIIMFYITLKSLSMYNILLYCNLRSFFYISLTSMLISFISSFSRHFSRTGRLYLSPFTFHLSIVFGHPSYSLFILFCRSEHAIELLEQCHFALMMDKNNITRHTNALKDRASYERSVERKMIKKKWA